MMRILQCLVWITVMAGLAKSQRVSHGYSQIAFPESPHLLPKPTSQKSVDNLDHRTRIKNRVSLSHDTIQISKRGAIDDAEDRVVFPDETAESTVLTVPEECKKQGYCPMDHISAKTKDHIASVVKSAIESAKAKFGDAKTVQERFQSDELDTQITKRFGGNNFNLCNASERIVAPGFLPDASDKWYPLAQGDDKKYHQNFRVEICNFNTNRSDRGCDNRVTVERGYESECVQNFSYRDVWVTIGKDMVKKSLKLPTCCSCQINLVG